jgi:hypothetical protein
VSRTVQRVIDLNGKLYVCPYRAAEHVGISYKVLRAYARRASSWFGMPLDVVKHGGRGRLLIDERDVFVLAAVNREFPVGKGPIPRAKREQMCQYSERIRAKLMPAPRA